MVCRLDVNQWLLAREGNSYQQINAFKMSGDDQRGICIQRPEKNMQPVRNLEVILLRAKFFVQGADSLPSGCFQSLRDQTVHTKYGMSNTETPCTLLEQLFCPHYCGCSFVLDSTLPVTVA